MSLFLLVLLLGSPLLSLSADLSYFLKQYPDVILQECNTAGKFSAMSQQEKDVVLLTNLVRKDPKKFSEVFIDAYVANSEFYESSNPYVISLKRDLQTRKPTAVLQVHNTLNKTAREHAVYCGTSGHMGHHGFDGRSKTAAKVLHHQLFGENCGYVRTEALDFVMDLLIDESIRDVGHRKNILHPKFTTIGVSIQPFKKGEFCLVQQFSAP
jgi:uncharacterized protein YkwD